MEVRFYEPGNDRQTSKIPLQLNPTQNAMIAITRYSFFLNVNWISTVLNSSLIKIIKCVLIMQMIISGHVWDIISFPS